MSHAGILATLVAVAVTAAAGSSSEAGSHSGSQSSGTAEYEAYRRQWRGSVNDTVSFDTRLRLYQLRKASVEAHNARSDKSWVATVNNKFADYTEDEMRALLGYRRHAEWSPSDGSDSGGSKMGSFLEVRGVGRVDEGVILDNIDWRGKLKTSLSSQFVKEQGGCGSCWAVAAAGALETLMEHQGFSPVPLSYEQLVDCTPNPRQCGGAGGCTGATGELAFEHVSRVGIVPADMYKGYQHHGDGKCKLAANQQNNFRISGFKRLPNNKLPDMLRALSNTGPAVVSVDATPWSTYSAGVFNDCAKDATINHAVLAVGYGHDSTLNKNYWLIRNSWGNAWGEKGFVRLERHDSDFGDAGWCGTDYNPKEGVGCDGGPTTIPVCGMCGVLSDTSYPYGIRKAPLLQTDSETAEDDNGLPDRDTESL